MLERLKPERPQPERPKRPLSKEIKEEGAQWLAHRGGTAVKEEAEEPEWCAKGRQPQSPHGGGHKAGQSQDSERGHLFCFIII